MLRLTGENGKREKPKVLIVILTAALYKSRPCLKEIDMAIKHEVELLPVRFEDRLPAKEDQWTNLNGQDWEMRKLRVQEKLNALNNIPNPGTVLNRAHALKDIMAAIDKYLPTPVDAPTPPTAAPASPAIVPAAAAMPPLPKSSGGPSDGTRFPLGSRVYVNRGHGEEVAGYVTTYDAAKDLYTVELGERGSGGAREMCSDKDLHIADSPISDSPISWLIHSARDKVGSLFGVNHLREGVPGNAAASEPTPQPPPLRFTLKERVECRDRGGSWQVGTVVSMEPLMVQPDGAGWTAGYRWDEVRVLGPEAVSKPPPQPPGAPLAMERERLTGESSASEPTPAEMQSSCFGLCSESEEAYAKRMEMERAEAAARAEMERAAAAARAEKERAEAAARAEKERAEAAARKEKDLKDALDSGLTLKQLRAKGYVEGLKA
eukprot:jgi/Chrpa1/25156/Chrysochromulina_OHIO_Genome00027417-RA